MNGRHKVNDPKEKKGNIRWWQEIVSAMTRGKVFLHGQVHTRQTSINIYWQMQRHSRPAAQLWRSWDTDGTHPCKGEDTRVPGEDNRVAGQNSRSSLRFQQINYLLQILTKAAPESSSRRLGHTMVSQDLQIIPSSPPLSAQPVWWVFSLSPSMSQADRNVLRSSTYCLLQPTFTICK